MALDADQERLCCGVTRGQRNDPAGNRSRAAACACHSGTGTRVDRIAVPVVAARHSGACSGSRDVQPGTRGNRRWPVRFGPTSSSSLPVRHDCLGQHEIAHLSLRRDSQLREYEGRRVHVRGRRPRRWRPRGDERASSLTLGVLAIRAAVWRPTRLPVMRTTIRATGRQCSGGRPVGVSVPSVRITSRSRFWSFLQGLSLELAFRTMAFRARRGGRWRGR
jgi:hypothetical protein